MNKSKNKNQMEYLEIKESSNYKETNNYSDEKYLRAKERITEVKEFYAKLLRSTLLIVFLAALNYYTNEWRYMWFLWAAFGIGIGLVSKGVKVFGVNPFLSKDWEERKIKEFMEEDARNKKWN
jgi:hypothetical protein